MKVSSNSSPSPNRTPLSNSSPSPNRAPVSISTPTSNRTLGVGLVGGGAMDKARAAAMNAVSSLFNTKLIPRLEMVCVPSAQRAQQYGEAYGFARATAHWQELVEDTKVEAVIIAAPQSLHRVVAQAAFSLGKPVFCEKPMGENVVEARAMAQAAARSGCVAMVGYPYIRAPATQYARHLISSSRIGEVIWFRGEYTEDSLADPTTACDWRTSGMANGTLGDLAPHMVNAAVWLVGSIAELSAIHETVHHERPALSSRRRHGGIVTNDDQAQFMCRFSCGAMGHMFFSRVATGAKMGLRYEVIGSKGAIRFAQEEQNSLGLYLAQGDEAERGFRKVIAGPSHPDYEAFCGYPGRGTGYQDQIILEARDFLRAIATGKSMHPTFDDGLEVAEVIAAVLRSSQLRSWQAVA